MAVIFLGFSLSASAFAEQSSRGRLTLYRWDTGKKVHNVPALETLITRSEALSIQKSGRYSSAETFRGCYLAQFSVDDSREPASAKKNFFRVCDDGLGR